MRGIEIMIVMMAIIIFITITLVTLRWEYLTVLYILINEPGILAIIRTNIVPYAFSAYAGLNMLKIYFPKIPSINTPGISINILNFIDLFILFRNLSVSEDSAKREFDID